MYKFTSPPKLVILTIAIAFLSGISCALQAQSYPPTLTPKPNNNMGQPTWGKIKGYYEYLPAGYNNPANSIMKYPVIIYFPGCGEMGDGNIYYEPDGTTVDESKGLGRLFLVSAIPLYVRNNLDYFSNVSIPGQNFGFIIISVQNWGEHSVCENYSELGESDIKDAVDYVMANYRVDKSRIYLTGMSAGANPIWSFAGNSIVNANRIAGIGPVSSTIGAYYDWAATVGASNLALLAMVNKGDQTWFGSDRYATQKGLVDYINALSPPPTTPAVGKYYDAPGHDAWTASYDPGTVVYSKNGVNYNLYEWFLLNQRNLSLPVTLKGFEAFYKDKKVNLSWVTSSEKNNDYFTLERSADGRNFTTLGKIRGLGNSNTGKTYQYVDYGLPTGKISYYRLSQTDIDGKKEIFGVKRVYIASAGYMVKVYPTVTSDRIIIETEGNNSEMLTVRISDISGKQLKRHVLAPRQRQLVMNISDLQRGVYVVQINSSTDQTTTKIIKQ